MNLTEWNAPFKTLIFRGGRRLSWLEREVLTWLPVPFPHGWWTTPPAARLEGQQLDWSWRVLEKHCPPIFPNEKIKRKTKQNINFYSDTILQTVTLHGGTQKNKISISFFLNQTYHLKQFYIETNCYYPSKLNIFTHVCVYIHTEFLPHFFLPYSSSKTLQNLKTADNWAQKQALP